MNADLSSILWNVGVENLVVLASRDRFPDSSERITSKRMQDLIKTFKKASPKPIIIFDLPPVLAADDAVAVSPNVDGVLMIASERETRREDLSHAMDLLKGANVLGVVLNKSGGR
jgi:Mrp family chromosome partitioning ATPase